MNFSIVTIPTLERWSENVDFCKIQEYAAKLLLNAFLRHTYLGNLNANMKYRNIEKFLGT